MLRYFARTFLQEELVLVARIFCLEPRIVRVIRTEQTAALPPIPKKNKDKKNAYINSI